MKVSVIILNYNGKNFIQNCIDSVLKSRYLNIEIIVLDNASTDNSYQLLIKKYGNKTKVKLYRSNKQLYFTGGCNFAAEKATGELLFFLNSDTTVEKNCIKHLVSFIGKNNKILVQPKILLYDKPNIIDNVGGRYDNLGIAHAVGRDEIDKGQYNHNTKYDYVNGTAFIINRELFNKIGRFNTSFHYFYEDVDLCLRAKQNGYECWSCYEAVVYHKGSLTFKRNISIKKQNFYHRRNRIITIVNNLNILKIFTVLPIQIISAILLQISDLLPRLVHKRFSLIFTNLLKNSSVVFIGNNITNVLNLIFALSMARLLGPKYYGEMLAIFSLLAIVNIPSEMTTNIMAKFTAGYNSEKQHFNAISLFNYGKRRALIIGSILLGVYYLFVPFLSSFLHVSKLPMLIFGLSIPITMLAAVGIGTLQGLQNFISFTTSSILATASKLVIGIVLVVLGFSISGVFSAFLIGTIFTYFYVNMIIKKKYSSINVEPSKSNIPTSAKAFDIKDSIYNYAKTFFITTLLFSILSTIDLILAKHYLSAEIAGQYAALTTIGRLITLSSAPIIAVIFPMISSSYSEKKSKETYILLAALSIIIPISCIFLVVFRTIPEYSIGLLFGNKFISVYNYLVFYGISSTLLVLIQTFLSYFLARNTKTFIFPLLFFTLLQILLIYQFHQNLYFIIRSNIIAFSLLLTSFLIIFINDYVKKK